MSRIPKPSHREVDTGCILHPNFLQEICPKTKLKKGDKYNYPTKHIEFLRNNWYIEEDIAALDIQIEQKEILQHFISLFPSRKSNS